MRQQTKKDDGLNELIQDFKTPTAAQIKALELFLSSSEGKINSSEKELIELTLNSCNHVQNLIETYNTVQKLEHEKIHLNYDKFNIVNLFKEIICDFKILLKYHDIDIRLNSPEEIIINADKNQIRKVIKIILTEAINSSFKKTIIDIDLIKQKNEFRAYIKNESPYIEPKILKELFEKNKANRYRLAKISSVLSFFLSKEIIAAHFGKMIAQSNTDNKNVLGFIVPVI